MTTAHSITVSKPECLRKVPRTWVFRLLPLFISILCVFSGCSKDKDISVEDLYGRWKATDGYYYTFNDDFSGRTFDDDDNGFDFSWTINGSELSLRIMGNGSTDKVVYQVFDIKSLKDSKMICVDIREPGVDITFTRQ